MKGLFKAITTLAAGVSLGVLFAPKKGKELRTQLSKSSDKMGDFGKQLMVAAEDASAEVKKFLQKPEVQDLIAKGKQHAEEIVQMSKDKGNTLSQKAKKELECLTKELGKKAKSVKKTTQKKAKAITKNVQKKVSRTTKKK